MAPLDDALEALADPWRRELLFALWKSERPGGTVSVPEDVVEGAATREQAVEYAHVHLPALEEQGYIDWDRRRDEVVEGPRFDELRPLLELLEAYEDRL